MNHKIAKKKEKIAKYYQKEILFIIDFQMITLFYNP